jgi:hypothetical protein
MSERDPRAVGDTPPDRRSEENPQGVDPDAAESPAGADARAEEEEPAEREHAEEDREGS